MANKSIGPKLSLYPMPLAVVGALNGDKPTWTLVAHVGIIGHDRILVSLASNHFINPLIKDNGKFSLNLVNEEMLPRADLSGFLSGHKADKSDLFPYHSGENMTPIIDASPIVMECEVTDFFPIEGFEIFVAKILNTEVNEEILDEKGRIDVEKASPVLFEFPTYSYLVTGRRLGPCFSFKPKENAK